MVIRNRTLLRLNLSAALALAIVAAPGLVRAEHEPEIIPYHQRRLRRSKGEKKRNKAHRWG